MILKQGLNDEKQAPAACNLLRSSWLCVTVGDVGVDAGHHCTVLLAHLGFYILRSWKSCGISILRSWKSFGIYILRSWKSCEAVEKSPSWCFRTTSERPP